ncbi:Anti-anti-sigma regulatory factor (antagonist of anti-sigma factor) [Trichlorobacter thiogenes]|uniref:Anti-anti-sigma regulatory factor (Antagonist of anti-sigma factor) n=1 Tax=Trichlorobacter thiogenes TaxID=115783 RepID=A0A1T4QXL4_9BACT|nr:Anti-anti-sigma regulatory factor (antagonist of anti-sigma factor) [Trichlorobacter thiogenes]
MELSISGTVAHLKGDWTLTGITAKNIHSLSDSLEQLGSRSHKNQNIDCKQITKFDLTGLQFLYTWLQCFRLRGIEPVLINLPDKMQHIFSCLEFQNCR